MNRGKRNPRSPPSGRAAIERKCFRGGLVFKAHRLLYHSTLGLRVIKKKESGNALFEHGRAIPESLHLPRSPFVVPKTSFVTVRHEGGRGPGGTRVKRPPFPLQKLFFGKVWVAAGGIARERDEEGERDNRLRALRGVKCREQEV